MSGRSPTGHPLGRAIRLLLVAVIVGVPSAAFASAPTSSGIPAAGPSGTGPRAFVQGHALGTLVGAMVYDPAVDELFASAPAWNSVLVLNPSNFTVLANISVGSAPLGLAVNPDAGRVYVANNGSASVSVIGDRARAVVATYAVGTDPTGVTYDPRNNTVYVANYGSGNISEINGTTGAKARSVATLSHPFALSATGGTVWVAFPTHDTVAEINGLTHTLVLTVSVGGGPAAICSDRTGFLSADRGSGAVTRYWTGGSPVTATTSIGGHPVAIVRNPVTGLVYASDPGPDDVVLLNGTSIAATLHMLFAPGPLAGVLSTGALAVAGSTAPTVAALAAGANLVLQVQALGGHPSFVVADGADGFDYVSEYTGASVALVSGATRSLYESIGGVATPTALAVDPSNGTVYAASQTKNALYRLDPGSDSAVGPIPVGSRPDGMAFDSRNGLLYVADAGSNQVSVVNVSLGRSVATITAGASPAGVAYLATTDRVYVADRSSNSVSVIDPGNRTVVATVPVGSSPSAVAVDPVHGRVFVTNAGSGNVSVIAGNRVVASIGVGAAPSGIAFDPVNLQVYVADNGSGNLSVFSASTYAVAASVRTRSPSALAFDAIQGVVLAASYATGNLSEVGGSRSLALAEFAPRLLPGEIAFQPFDRQLFLSNAFAIDALDAANGTPVAEVDSTTSLFNGGGISGIAVDPTGGSVFLAHRSLGTLDVVNGTTDRVSASLAIRPTSSAAYDVRNGTVFVPATSTTGAAVIDVVTAANATLASSFPDPSYATVVTANPVTGDVWGIGRGSGGIAELINGTANSVVLTVPIGWRGGSSAFRAASDGPGDDLYVLVNGAVSVINASNGTVAKVIGVGASPQDLIYDPSAGAYVVANAGSKNLSVIDPSTNTVARTIALPAVPGHLAFGGGELYVILVGWGGIARLNASTFRWDGFYRVSSDPGTLRLGPSAPAYAYPSAPSNSIGVVQTARDEVDLINEGCTVGACGLSGGWGVGGGAPVDLALSSACAFTADADSASVSVVPIARFASCGLGVSSRTPTPFRVGVDPEGVVYDLATKQIYVANRGSNTLTVINVSGSLTRSFTVHLSAGPAAMLLVPSNGRIYVAEPGANRVVVVQPPAATVVATISVGSDPTFLAFDPGQREVLVVNYGSSNVSSINVTTNTVAGSLSVPAGPVALSVSPFGGAWFLAASTAGEVVEIRGGAVVQAFPTGPGLGGVVVDPISGAVWVSNDGTHALDLLSFGS